MASSAKLEKRDASSSFDDIMAVLDRDGAVIIRGLLHSDEQQELYRELDPYWQTTQFCVGTFFGGRTKRIHSLVAKSATCRTMITNALVLGIMQGLLGAACERIQLNLTQGIQIWPGEKAQMLHRDDDVFPAMSRGSEFMVNAMWAQTAFTSANGATLVVPGSHKWQDRKRQAEKHEITQAEMVPGELLIYLGSALHGGGTNQSDAPRTGLVISYCLGWLRQYENQYFAAPPEIARHFTKELQDLLGYSVHRPNLGMYEGNEPSVLFEDAHLRNLRTHDWLTSAQEERVRQYQARRGT